MEAGLSTAIPLGVLLLLLLLLLRPLYIKSVATTAASTSTATILAPVVVLKYTAFLMTASWIAIKFA